MFGDKTTVKFVVILLKLERKKKKQKKKRQEKKFHVTPSKKISIVSDNFSIEHSIKSIVSFAMEQID